MKAGNLAIALLAGLVFGAGLSISGMLDPVRVVGFLDVTGDWDPRLAFVLAGAVMVAALFVRIAGRMRRPLAAPAFDLPPTRPVTARLVAGAALFGIGWGLSGLCPGPAIASFAFAAAQTWPFLLAMAAGMLIYDRLIAPRLS